MRMGRASSGQLSQHLRLCGGEASCKRGLTHLQRMLRGEVGVQGVVAGLAGEQGAVQLGGFGVAVEECL